MTHFKYPCEVISIDKHECLCWYGVSQGMRIKVILHSPSFENFVAGDEFTWDGETPTPLVFDCTEIEADLDKLEKEYQEELKDLDLNIIKD